MARITGAARTLTLAGSAIVGKSAVKPKFTSKLEEVKTTADGFQNRVYIRTGWRIAVDFEWPELSSSLGAISAGGWDGANVEEWSLDVDMALKECSAQGDVWEVHQATGADWSFKATKWQASDSLNIFRAALLAQSGSASISLPFGTMTGLLKDPETTWDDDVAKESIEIVCAAGPLTVGDYGDTLIGYINTAIAAVQSQGYANPLAVVCSDGSGNAFIDKLSFKCPDGHVTGTVSLTGTGAFTAS